MKIKGNASSRKIWIDTGDGWKYLSPVPSQQLANHSPNGFNWGYGGSGPAQLALALCLAAGLSRRQALKLYPTLKFELVSRLPVARSFEIEFDVADWAKRKLSQSRDGL